MQETVLGTVHRKIFFIVLVMCFVVVMLSYYDTKKLINYEVFFSTVEPTVINYTLPSSLFLVSSSKCKIINLHPFNPDAKKYFQLQKYKACRSKELLTYVTKNDNTATLHVDFSSVPSYSKSGVKCCSSAVNRKVTKKSPDGGVSIAKCEYFDNNTIMHSDVVIVKCKETRHNRTVYENAHVAVTIKEDVQKKLDNIRNDTKPLSILFIGIDSISRLNFIRALPNTYRYIEDKGWINLKGYNKMDDNTFPNVMAILTGYNQTRAYSVCNPKVIGKLDKCPMLWYDFRRLGYVTGYAEDEASINTFNYRKKGFTKQPTDYYFRPYVMATEKLDKKKIDGMTYCTGPETAGERIMNVAKDFAVTFNGYPHFGFFWMNSFSHNQINSVSGMDNKIKNFLIELENNNIFNNTLVIFLSDHGMRFGPIRLTESGWLEERLPVIYFSFPPWFIEAFPKEYNTFKNNQNKFTTPYDLHMTLKHILVLSGFNYTVTPGDACPNCKSLFEEIETERSCEDANIEQHWCTCAGYEEVVLNGDEKDFVSRFILDQIYKITSNALMKNADEKCAKFSLGRLVSTSVTQQMSYRNSSYLRVRLETNPKAVFETTLVYQGSIHNGLKLSGEISRLDVYGDHSYCVDDAFVKKYCYCSVT